MNLLIRLIISTLAVLISAYLLPGIHIDNFLAALVAAIVLGALNIFLKPVLIFLAFPAVVITLGLFLVVINTLLILLTAEIVPGFRVDSFWDALFFSIILSVITYFLNLIRQRDEQR